MADLKSVIIDIVGIEMGHWRCRMHYSIGVEYALHSLVLLISVPDSTSLGIRDIATYLGVQDSYLSKTFTKLAKAGLVSSLPGVKGGYQLARSPAQISLWEVVEAIEGPTPIFRCTEVRRRSVLFQGQELPDYVRCSPCLINVVMLEAEQQMRSYLQDHSLAGLHEDLQQKLPPAHQEASQRWIHEAVNRR